MSNGSQRTNFGLWGVAAATLGAATLQAGAVTYVYDTSNAAGFTATSGTWDLNNTINWSPATGVGDATDRTTWLSNANVAAFQFSANATVTTSGNADAGTQLGAAGLQFGGNVASNISLTIAPAASPNNSPILLSGGLASTVGGGYVTVNTAIELIGSQTWTSNSTRAANAFASVRVNGAITGTANLTFDGLGVSSANAVASASQRAGFSLGGSNTFSGTTTVKNGALLYLDYNSNSNQSRLDDNSALILAGGTVAGNGGSGIVEIVGSTTIAAGASSIIVSPVNGGGNTANKLQLNHITHQFGGTVDIQNSTAVATTKTANTGGILGGWATIGLDRFATGATTAGTDTNIGNTAGNNRTSSSAWLTADNVSNTNTLDESNIGSKTVNSLRLTTTSGGLSFQSGATLAITSGGLIVNANGKSITGGKIVTGFTTGGVGELFVHAPAAGFTIGSEIADNGATPAALVKDGLGTLTLSGANTYTGGTFVNAGTVTVSGSLADSDITIAGAATLNGAGTLTYNIANDNADLINLLPGAAADISGLTLNLVATGTQTQTEYVIVNSLLATEFSSATVLPAGWSIDYDGTATNPNSIVAVAVPEPAGLLALGMASIGLMARRRRA